MTTTAVDTRTCMRCAATKPTTDFYTTMVWCIECHLGHPVPNHETRIVPTHGVPRWLAALLAKTQGHDGTLAELAAIFTAEPTFQLTGWWLDNRFQTEGRGSNWTGAVVFDFATSETIR